MKHLVMFKITPPKKILQCTVFYSYKTGGISLYWYRYHFKATNIGTGIAIF